MKEKYFVVYYYGEDDYFFEVVYSSDELMAKNMFTSLGNVVYDVFGGFTTKNKAVKYMEEFKEELRNRFK